MITKLKFPTGRRQTSWLFTKRDREIELRATKKQIPLMAGGGPEPGTSGLQHQCPKLSAMLPPLLRIITMHIIMSGLELKGCRNCKRICDHNLKEKST